MNQFTKYDSADYLTTKERIAAYREAVMELELNQSYATSFDDNESKSTLHKHAVSVVAMAREKHSLR